MKLFKKILVGIASLVIIMVGAAFYISIQQTPPDNLLVLADHTNKTYISPECLSGNVDYESSEFETLSLEKVRSLDYDSDSVCTDESLYPSRSMAWNLIGTKIGIVKPLDWKWNDNGTWKEEALS